MPQVDLETLVCGGDGKVSCETLADDPPPDPAAPPDSIIVPLDDASLIAAGALVYDRGDSAKESTNPKSHSSSSANPAQIRSNSTRYAGAATNGPIIGLPNKLKLKHVTSSSSHRGPPPTSSRIFPKKTQPTKPGSKSAVPEAEPSSPKVSCFGKVLSDRERERCRRDHRRPTPDRLGCWAGLFSCGGRAMEQEEEEEEVGREVEHTAARGDILLRRGNVPLVEVTTTVGGELAPPPPPGLGGMKKLSSGRRAASWGGDVEAAAGGGNVAWDLSRRSLDEGRVAGPTWGA